MGVMLMVGIEAEEGSGVEVEVWVGEVGGEGLVLQARLGKIQIERERGRTRIKGEWPTIIGEIREQGRLRERGFQGS